MRTRLWVVRVLFLPFLGLVFWGWAHGAFAQQEAVIDKSQITFHKDSTGYVYLAPGVNLKSYDTVVIGNFSIFCVEYIKRVYQAGQ